MTSCKRNVFVCGLFRIAATSLVYRVRNKLERMGKEAFVAHFKVLSRNLPGEREENHKIVSHYRQLTRKDLNPQPV